MSTVMRMHSIDDAAPPDAVPADAPAPVRALAPVAVPGGAPAAPAAAAPLRLTPAQRLGRTLRRELPTWALGALSIVLLIGFWHLATTYRWVFYIRFTNVPGPVEVFGEAMNLFGNKGFTTHVMLSLRRIMLGFAIATVLGVTLGLLIGRYRHVRSLLFPAMEILRPIPAIAWVPISIMLWPTTETSIVFITFIGAFFPILLNTVHGVATMDAVLVRAARCLGATEFALMTQVVLRGAMPHIFTGLAVGMGVAWVSLIAAEMISGQYGVGYFTWEAYSLIEYSNIVIGMLVIGVLGLACSGVIRLLGRVLMPWQASSGKENSR
jgi:NitT/TauT family transport system permease protein